MNPRPSGHTIGSAHLATPALADDELAQRARQTWTCATCGTVLSHTNSQLLRHAAIVHAALCAAYFRQAAENPSRESGNSGTD